MKKILIILLAILGLFSLTCCATMPTTAKSESIKPIPQCELKNYSITDKWGQPVELLVGYTTTSWRAVVEKTGVSRGWWIEKNTDYTDITNPHRILIKCRTSKGTLIWGCFDFHGDGTLTFYTVNL